MGKSALPTELVSTTLADLFMPIRFGDLSSAVRASLRSWLNDEIDDGLAHGRQARLSRGVDDFFFSVPLLREGDNWGIPKLYMNMADDRSGNDSVDAFNYLNQTHAS